jgi:hypothetical protein
MTIRELTYPGAVEINSGAYVLEIGYDTNPESPRKWDNAGTFYLWERGYSSPDKCDYGSMERFILEWIGAECQNCGYTPLDHEGAWTDCTEYAPDRVAPGNDPDAVLFLISHNDGYSLQRFTVSDLDADSDEWKRFDGVLFATGDTVRREWGGDNAAAVSCLLTELETYTAYANGNVFTASWERVKICEACSHDEREPLDSVSGFYIPFNPSDYAPADIPAGVLAEIMAEFLRYSR